MKGYVGHRGRSVTLLIFLSLITVITGLWFMLTQPLINPAHREVEPVSEENLERHVRFLSLEAHPRDHLHPEQLDKAALYIRRELERSGAKVSEQEYEVRDRTYRNVSALFPGEGSERLVIGAHYDAAGPLPGADDNASGVAGVLELARLMKDDKLKTSVELVAYTLEEPPYFSTPHMGSMVHAQALKRDGVNVRLMISLEMIGYFSDEEGSQRYPAPAMQYIYPTIGNFIAVVGTLSTTHSVRIMKQAMTGVSDLPVYSLNAPDVIPGIHLSDHTSYWKEGFEAVMITNTAYFRNPNYHTERDTPETLDYKRMAKVVEGTYAAIVKLSQ